MSCVFLVAAAVFSERNFVLAQSNNAFTQLVEAAKAEMARKEGRLFVSMHWPNEQGRAVAPHITKDFPFIREVTYERSSGVANSQRMLMEAKQGRVPNFDVLGIVTEMLGAYAKEGLFIKPPYDYRTVVKFLPSDWPRPDPRAIDPGGIHIATAALARGIAYNKNLVPAHKIPKEWDDCLDPLWRGKFLYDPRPKLFPLQHDPKTKAAHLKWLKGIVENKVVLTRGQVEGLEQLAAGEYPLFCGINYHSAMPMIDEGAPMGFVFPDPVPVELATVLHVLKWTKLPATTELFALWLATRAQPLVDKESHRGAPWDASSRKYPLVKGKYIAVCGVDCLLKKDEYLAEHSRILGLPGAK